MNQILVNSLLLGVYFTVLVAIGLMCRKRATDVNGFVLGGRAVGPWLTAFAFGTSYFSAVVFVGYAGQFGWRYGLSATWAGIGSRTPHPHHDATPGLRHNARLLRKALR